MKTRIFLLSVITLFAGLAVMAKDENPENYHMRGILADGTEIEGYNEKASLDFMYEWTTDVKLADTYKGESKKYSSEELKAIWFTALDEDSIPKIYHSVKAQKSMTESL